MLVLILCSKYIKESIGFFFWGGGEENVIEWY